MSTSSNRDEPHALRSLTELVQKAVQRPTSSELARGLTLLRLRVAAARSARSTPKRWALLAATLIGGAGIGATAVAVGISVLREDASVWERPAALSRIEGGLILDGGYLSETRKEGIKLFFDEGSEFVLAPGTRGRLRGVEASGASLSLEHGTASLVIVPSRERRWSVEAGPFVVAVKGTDFTVSWDSARESFELQLRRGSVGVSGPVVGKELVLGPGQKLTVSLPKAETVISELRPAQGPDSEEASAASPVPGESAAPAPSASSGVAVPAEESASVAPPSAAPAERGFRRALASGQWDKILADTEREGVERVLRTASSDDLLALADAARYRRRAELARAALLAQRSRFPSSPRSVEAAFLLGRVEESRANGKSEALRWYGEYLARAPSGTYAAEALGRKMILTKELSGPASAEPLAAEYLRRFPDGSYAGAARTLEQLP